MAPFRELLASKTTKAWLWDDTMTALFNESKEEIVRQVCEGVKSFEAGRPTALSTDWSRTGIGYTLTQKHCSCPGRTTPLCGEGHWKLVYAGSRFTRGPETRYAPIEGEALAAVYGLQSCKYFILGCPDLTLAVDHKPLIKILNDRSLESINNPRMVQLKEKTMMFRYRIIHIPGKQHMAPDHLSRHPCNTEGDGSAVDENMGVAFAAIQADGIHAVSFADIRN